ncbi:MAG: hypothetical protein JST68_02085 [Bacteroidetes bacterium]|nr:hypothetical protein [Bacteroidota bacterium]
MKLPLLLSQFLYQTRKLDLPGLGSFTLDAGAVIPQESDRMGQVPASGISFKNANISTPDEALILFIKEHTGKMKSLAAADLDFFLTTGRQLLNIGKPFYLEGIGTLLKNKEGNLDFTPGEYVVARLEDPITERKSTPAFEEATRPHEAQANNNRQVLLLVALVGGLIIIGWGGYYLYKKNNFVEPNEQQAKVIPETVPSRTDSTTVAATGDSTRKDTAKTGSTAGAPTTNPSTSVAATSPTTTAAVPATTPAGAAPPPPATSYVPVPSAGQSLYRFVILETGNKNRALRRYNQLIGYQLNIKMDQKDSAYFKLYFPIAAGIRDTTHIRDSLADVYGAHVTIEP